LTKTLTCRHVAWAAGDVHELDANRRLLKALFVAGEPDQHTVDGIRGDNQEIDRRITALQARLDALPPHVVDRQALRALYDRLRQPDLAQDLMQAQETGDVAGLRELLAGLVAQAVIVQRIGGGANGKTSWVRIECSWTPDIQLLLQHGVLTLDPPAPAPWVPATTAERLRHWRARRRAARQAELAPLPEGLITLDQAAQEFGLTKPALRGAIRRGFLTAMHIEGRGPLVFLNRTAVEQYKQEHAGRRGRPATHARETT
jgi:hypothetical protein